MNPSRICFFAIFSKDFRKLRSSDVLAILLIAYGHILPKLFEFFKLNIEIAQNIFDCFRDIAENMGVLVEKLLKIRVDFLFSAIFGGLRKDLFCRLFLPVVSAVSFRVGVPGSSTPTRKLTAREWNGSAGFLIYKVL